LDRERQWLTLLREPLHVELRLTHGSYPGFLDRIRVPRAERTPQRLIEHGLPAQAPDHERRRHPSLAETGHAHLAAELASGLVDAALDLLRGDLGMDAD